MRPRKSTPVLTAKQRRRQIINLLAGQLARMPEGIDIPMSSPESPPDSGQQITSQGSVCQVAHFGSSGLRVMVGWLGRSERSERRANQPKWGYTATLKS